MKKNYLIFIFLLMIISSHTHVFAQTPITPKVFCLGSCPITPSTSSVSPPSTSTSNTPSPSVTHANPPTQTSPCTVKQTVSINATKKHKHIPGVLSEILQLLLQFLINLLQQLLGIKIPLPSTGNPPPPISTAPLPTTTVVTPSPKPCPAITQVTQPTSSIVPTNTSIPAPKPTATIGSYDNVVRADEPIAFWDMKTPTSTEIDITGNGHSGIYKGGTPILVALPNGDQAVDFNGSSEFMTVPSSQSLSISTTHQLTWEAWIRPDVLQFPKESSGGYVDWLGKCQNYSPTCEWEARMYSTNNPQGRCNRLSAYVFNLTAGLGSGADWQPVCNLFQAGQWLHVIGEYQTLTTPSQCNASHPGTITIWVNGVEWNEKAHSPTGCMSQYGITPQASNSPLNIGSVAFDSWFKGAIGKVAIYNKLLSQTQISNHFNAMTKAQPSGSCDATCTIQVPTH